MSRYLQVLVIGVILGAFMVSAQVSTGTISGVVQDQSGAVIAGAMVIVRNVDTGAARTLTSDPGGRYIAPNLSVGNYEVQGQQSGFQTEIRSGITLTVGREAVINLALKVGQLSDRVTITAEAPLVESTSSALSSLVDARTIRDLPLNGRSWVDLSLLQPGVVTVGAGQASSAFDYGTGARFSVAGSRAYANSFMLDGTDINDHANGTPGGASGTNLGVDGVEEFKINTSVSPAEYGRSSGGVVSAVTKSGTNSLHGGVFEFLRNNALDSPGYFDGGTTAPYRRNQFGGFLGGPIKKDKTFFFGTYEGMRQGNGNNYGPVVPTAATKAGIVPNTSSVFQSADPARERALCAVLTSTTCTIKVTPAVQQYLNLFQSPTPGPNADLGDGTGIFSFAPTQVSNENYFMTRVDHQISENTRIFFRYSFDKDSNVLPNFGGSAIADEQDLARRQYSTIQLNNTLRPTLLNSLRFAFNRTYQNFDDVISNPAAASLFFVPGEHFGTVSFGSQGLSGNAGSGPLNFLGVDNGAPRIYSYNMFQEGDDLTWVKGRHTLKVGVDVKRYQDNETTASNSRGDYTFYDIPFFLAGIPFRFDAPPPGSNGYRGLRETLFGAYVQDDFKVTQRLTLNLGLRWEAISNPYEVNGKMARLLNISDKQTTVLKDSYFAVTKKDFQPRVGFAWQLNGSGKTVLRAGFGIFHDHLLPYSFVAIASGTPPYWSTISDNRLSVADTLANRIPFPNDVVTGGVAQFNSIGTTAAIKEPTKLGYNLNLQQQVMKDTLLEVAYIGSGAHHLQRSGEINPTTLSSPGVFSGTSRINPLFASLTGQQWDVNANYNALQVTLKRRAASGLQYQAVYTWAKSIDDKTTIAGGESRQEPNTVLDYLNPGRDRGRSALDARQNLVLSSTYPVPFRFKQKVVGAILGGWTLNGIGTFRTGEPFTARVGSNRSQDGNRWNPDRPNLNPGFSPDPTSGVSAGCGNIAKGTPLGTPSLYYDPCAFSRPAVGTYGNLGRNTLTGPGFFSVDASLAKVFKPTERVALQFRAEVFNLLDQAHFYIPAAGNVFSGSAGHISTLVSSPGGRLMQFGVKVLF